MALKTVGNKDYKIEFKAGDTEYLRLNIKDGDGNPMQVGSDYTCIIGIKRKITDTEFIVPEKMAAMYNYSEFIQPHSIEFKFTDVETVALLNYNGKLRKSLIAYYDVELTHTVTGDVSTILSGVLSITRSIGGNV